MKAKIAEQEAAKYRSAKSNSEKDWRFDDNYGQATFSNKKAEKAFEFLGKVRQYLHQHKEFEKSVKEHLENLCDSISDNKGQKNMCLSQLPQYKEILCGAGSLQLRSTCEDIVEASFKDVKVGVQDYFNGWKKKFVTHENKEIPDNVKYPANEEEYNAKMAIWREARKQELLERSKLPKNERPPIIHSDRLFPNRPKAPLQDETKKNYRLLTSLFKQGLRIILNAALSALHIPKLWEFKNLLEW